MASRKKILHASFRVSAWSSATSPTAVPEDLPYSVGRLDGLVAMKAAVAADILTGNERTRVVVLDGVHQRFRAPLDLRTRSGYGERLAGVVIENLPWQTFIDRYDAVGTLFYLDPPYWGSEGDYGRHLFDRSQFEQLSERLGQLKGRFIMSSNDVPEIRKMFGCFNFEEVSLSYGLAATGPTKARELIITD